MVSPHFRRTAAAAATGLLLVGISACGGDSGTSEGADKSITLYSGREESLIQPLLDQFTQDTGIKVEVRYGDTAAMATQVLEEADRSTADVFLAQDAGALGAVAKTGLFTTLPQDVTDRVPAQYRADDSTWVGVTGRARVLVYNPEKVAEADLPGSVLELTESRWDGQLGIAPVNGSFQAFVTGLRVAEGEDTAKQFLTGLKDNNVQIREKNGPIVEDVAAGVLSAGLVNHYYVYEKAAEAGVDVSEYGAKLHFFAGGDAGGLINVSGLGVLKKAADDPDVSAFVGYLLDNDAQTYFAEQTYEYPLIEGVEIAPGLPAITELDPPAIDLSDLDSLAQTVALIQEAELA